MSDQQVDLSRGQTGWSNISSAHFFFLHVRDAFPWAAPSHSSSPPSPSRTVLQSEFSPFAWRLGFIWNQRGSHSAAARPDLKESPVADGRPGTRPISPHHLETVRATWSHAAVLRTVRALALPTFDILLCPGEFH